MGLFTPTRFARAQQLMSVSLVEMIVEPEEHADRGLVLHVIGYIRPDRETFLFLSKDLGQSQE